MFTQNVINAYLFNIDSEATSLGEIDEGNPNVSGTATSEKSNVPFV